MEHELGQKSVLKSKTFMYNNFNALVPFFVKELNSARLPQLLKQKKMDGRLNRVQGQKKWIN
jgi:hypothetical protein